MRLKLVYFIPILSLLLTSCGSGDNQFSIKADIADMPEQTVYLSELGIDKITLIDSVEAPKSGKFTLSAKVPEAGLYRISFSADKNKYILLSADMGKIEVITNWNSLDQITINGSPSSQSLNNFLKAVRNQMQTFNTFGMILDSFKARGDDSMISVVQNDITEENFKFTHFIEQYADSTVYLPNALFAVQFLNPQSEKTYIQQFIPGMNKRFPNSKLAKDFSKKIDNIFKSMNESENQDGQTSPGNPAPEISLQTPDGKVVTLTSFKGKYVLVDFWASWCGPCRKENPNVVAAYNKFKDKNFTILGVSLDEEKEKWIEAINKDGLIWTHVSDLKGWESVAARIYSVQSIPANFLVDPQGMIIAKDLRGADLEMKLAQVIK